MDKKMAKADIDVKIISRECVKPSSPTPPHLKTFNLSFFDQSYLPHYYPCLLLFYPFIDHHDHDQDRRVRDLKSSLSETLTRFYPLAGRFVGNEPFVDCTDEGVDFLEAKVSCNLTDILENTDPAVLSRLLPHETVFGQGDAHYGAVMLVQANLFACGGLALCVTLAHRIGDGVAINLLIKGWAANARGAGDLVEPDLTAIASRFPAVRDVRIESGKSLKGTKSYKTRRFVFDSNSIDALKSKATSASLQRPSRIEVVAGHIWLSTIKLIQKNTARTRSHVLSQSINLRKIIDPPLSDNSFGNLVQYSFALARGSDEKVPHLEGLVHEIRRGLQHAFQRYTKKNTGIETFMKKCERRGEISRLVAIEDVEIIMVSSLCRFGFYELSDFGWGNPVWVSLGTNANNEMNTIALIDSKDGGIEGWVTLEEHVMDHLETDQHFLQFASMTSTVDLP